ncbi:MAG: hypothetical protein P8Y18_05195 [Candidatus Bathyarchaeota archaeon]
MPQKYPIAYRLHPNKIDKGIHWVTLELKNIGSEILTDLSINLNSLDTYFLTVLGTGKYLMDLKPKEQEAIPFQVSTNGSTKVYGTIDGWQGEEEFSWVSPNIQLKVGLAVAELLTLFTMTTPYPPLGETLTVEATVLGLIESEGLSLEFWAEAPSGKFEELATIETKNLTPGEEATYTAEITPLEEGFYTIYAYLYDGNERLGMKIQTIWVRKE